MTKFIGRLALALVALAAGTGAATAGHTTAAHADTADNCHQYQFQSSLLELNQPVAANRLDQENALPTDAKATWCLKPFTVNGVTVASQVVNKQTGDCMFARGELGGPVYAQPCSNQLGDAWAVNRGNYNGTYVVWFTSYYFNVNVDVYHDRRDSGAPIIAYRPYPPTPTLNELMREQ